MNKTMKNLTPRFCMTQFMQCISNTGATSFATAYLLAKGLPSGVVGTLLAMAGLLSCVTQPLLASAADRSKKFLLIKMLLAMSAVCCLCFGLQLLPGVPLMAAGILYMAAVWSGDAMVSLINALSVACNAAGHAVNFGAGIGIGAGASAISTLVIGFILARWGSEWMLVFLLVFRALGMLVLLGYPAIEKAAPQQSVQAERESTVLEFFSRYRWYCASLLGVLFLGMFLAMSDNYMIAIMGRLGGDSSHVGKALFISSIAAAPVMFFFSHVRRHISDAWLLKIAALTFLARAVLVYFAAEIWQVYLIQTLHVTSYAFLGPTQVYYAGARVKSCDMVKGQAFIIAAFALGCSLGNFAGGQLLTLGVDALLRAGILMVLVGTVVMFLTVDKKDQN